MSALTPKFSYRVGTLTSAKCWSVPHMPQHVTASHGVSINDSYIHICRIESLLTFDKNLVVIYLWDWYGDNVQLSWLRTVTAPGQ